MRHRSNTMRRGKHDRSSHRQPQRGSMTFFGVGMVMVLLFVGGISTDLWRAFGERRALAEMADAAASAGSNGVDMETYRQTGVVLLDPALAEQLAWDSLVNQADRESLSGTPIVVATADGVTVEVHGQVELVLLQIFAPGEPLEITVAAQSAPARGLGP